MLKFNYIYFLYTSLLNYFLSYLDKYFIDLLTNISNISQIFYFKLISNILYFVVWSIITLITNKCLIISSPIATTKLIIVLIVLISWISSINKCIWRLFSISISYIVIMNINSVLWFLVIVILLIIILLIIILHVLRIVLWSLTIIIRTIHLKILRRSWW